MSRYDKLASGATARPWDHFGGVIVSPPKTGLDYIAQTPASDCTTNADLIVALVNAGPDIAALWEAAEASRPTVCRDEGMNVACASECEGVDRCAAGEALRPLFGGDAK